MPKIKICGLSRHCDIEYVNEAKPDYVGFIFAESKRQISSSMAVLLKAKLDSSIRSVGVFVNAPVSDIISLLRDGVIDIVQLHGQEDEAYVYRLKELTDVLIIKAIQFDTEQVKLWESSKADFLLLDHGKGGTGMSFDWSHIGALQRPYFLAGGVSLSNIEEAIQVNPYCIDVSSGVETDRYKDREKILALVNRVRGK